MIEKIQVPTEGQGLYEITSQIQGALRGSQATGLCHLFIQHTSASLIIQENADPTAKTDLESWLNRLVPENDSLYTHTFEGADDMPAHIKSILTQTEMSIPIQNGKLLLGTWQGIYLWEHRHTKQNRQVIVTILPASV